METWQREIEAVGQTANKDLQTIIQAMNYFHARGIGFTVRTWFGAETGVKAPTYHIKRN